MVPPDLAHSFVFLAEKTQEIRIHNRVPALEKDFLNGAKVEENAGPNAHPAHALHHLHRLDLCKRCFEN